MNKICVFFCVFLIIFSKTGYAAENPRFSKKEINALDLLKQVKKFEKTIGLKETKNFQKFEKNNTFYTDLFYQEKTKIPFSYLHPDLKYRPVNHEKLDDALNNLNSFLKEKITSSRYDLFLYNSEAKANGTRITKRLLNSEKERLIYVVIHEDWHDNAALPSHIEEASGDLIGYVGMWKFLGVKDKGIEILLKERLRRAEAINRFYKEFDCLALRYSFGRIDKRMFKSEKEKIISHLKDNAYFPNFSSMTKFSFFHTYTYYFPLMCELFRSLGFNLNKFIAVLKETPFRTTAEENSDFYKTKKIERKIESYLKNYLK